jgi:prepilin-type processing-associated H-X9-DG protein
LSNVKQLALGVIMYCSDNDDKYPICPFTYTGGQFSGTGGGPVDLWWSWMDGIYPYVKNLQIFVCPSAPPWQNAGPAHSYQVNDFVIGPTYQPNGLGQSIVSTPSTKILLGEWSGPGAWIDSDVLNEGWYAALIHNGDTNVGFCDGHAKWLVGNADPMMPNDWTGTQYALNWDPIS